MERSLTTERAVARMKLGRRRRGLLQAVLFPAVMGAISCQPAEQDDDTVDVGPPAPDLIMPDLTGLDMEASLQQGLGLTVISDLRAPWGAFTSTFERAAPGCPDVYSSDAEAQDEMSALYWSDSCKTNAGLFFDGELGWEVSGARDYIDESRYVEYGQRSLLGNARVEEFDTRLLAFSGEASDSYYQSFDPAGNSWTYSAQLAGTVSGALAFSEGAIFTGGLREELYINYKVGTQDLLSLRGDVFLLQETFDRFDSVSLDITLYGTRGAPPNACQKEPYGYIGLRDTSAYWYEVVFMPIGGPDDDAEDAACDGCGTLFVRGVEQETPVCLSFDGLWEALAPPVFDDYIFSTRY